MNSSRKKLKMEQMDKEIEKIIDREGVLHTLLQLGVENAPTEEILKSALNLIFSIKWLPFDPMGCVFLIENEDLVMEAQIGLPSEIQGKCARIPIGECICGLSVRENRIIFSERNYSNNYFCEIALLHRPYCVPIRYKGNVIGVLNLYVKEGCFLDSQHEEFVISVSNALASIIAHRKDEEKILKLSLAVEQSPDWIVITDKNGKIEYINQAVEKISGYRRDEIIGKKPNIFKSEKHDAKFYKDLWNSITSGQPFSAIFINRKKNGELFHLHQTVTSIKDGKGNIIYFVGTGKDITQQKLMEEKLRFFTYYDSLTGLPNRNLFFERLEIEIQNAEYGKKILGIGIIDIKGFRHINEVLGWKSGDKVLVILAERLKNSIRRIDFISRMGNDEYGIIFSNISSPKDIISFSERISETVLQPLNIQGHELSLSFNIGISIYPEDGRSAEELINNAFEALKEAKKDVNITYKFYRNDLNVTAFSIMRLKKILFNALKNKEFYLQYQPYFNTSNKKIAGLEALLRWNNKELGKVPPSSFIPLLEETGWIAEVGDWILETVCRQIKEWLVKRYRVVPISVNLSLVQFKKENFAESVLEIINKHQINPELVNVEITESIFTQNIDFISNILKRFKEKGISIFLDDFGTGYSSFSAIRKYLIDFIKIDISFIKGIADDPDLTAMVSAIISMAHTLNIKTIAEGVENEETLKLLRLLKCDYVQGFYLSHPLDPEKIPEILPD